MSKPFGKRQRAAAREWVGMKIKTVVYWTATGLISLAMAGSAELYFTRNPKMMKQFDALGYPRYFPLILGVFKVLGVGALLAPRTGVVREWAYAGFGFTFLGAAASHLAKGNEKETAGPLVTLLVLAASYLTRPPERKVLPAE